MSNKSIKRELIWLGSIGLIDFLVIEILVGWGNWGIDTVIRDTYIILTVKQVFFIIFLNVAFLTYLFKQVLNRFKNSYGNLILLIVTGLLIYVSSITVKFIGSMDQGWIIYPLVSSSPIILKEKFKITSDINLFVQFYELVQIIVLSAAGIMTGRNWNK